MAGGGPPPPPPPGCAPPPPPPQARPPARGPDVTLVPTGIALEAPAGYDVQIRPRSGLGRLGVSVLFGTLDADYRGEVLVSMHTVGARAPYRVQHGDRVAQIVVARAEALPVVLVEELAASERDAGGHGSTGR